jgi:hypothetical protein
MTSRTSLPSKAAPISLPSPGSARAPAATPPTRTSSSAPGRSEPRVHAFALARRLTFALVLIVACGIALGSESAFDALPAEEQRVLMPFADSWDTLTPEARAQMRLGAQRWLAMSPEQRSNAAERLAQWRRLEPEQRARLREAHQRFRALSPEQQRRLRSRFREFQNLPPEQRQELRRRFEAMSPAERRAFATGAEAMRRAQRGPGGRPGPFAHLPQDQREATWTMIRSLSPDARLALRREFETLPEDQRELLRQELLAMSPTQREARLLRR